MAGSKHQISFMMFFHKWYHLNWEHWGVRLKGESNLKAKTQVGFWEYLAAAEKIEKAAVLLPAISFY